MIMDLIFTIVCLVAVMAWLGYSILASPGETRTALANVAAANRKVRISIEEGIAKSFRGILEKIQWRTKNE